MFFLLLFYFTYQMFLVFIKNKYITYVLLSKSVKNQFDLLALNIEVSKTCNITLIGCYRPPSAVN